jgi:hypothetical protein
MQYELLQILRSGKNREVVNITRHENNNIKINNTTISSA